MAPLGLKTISYFLTINNNDYMYWYFKQLRFEKKR